MPVVLVTGCSSGFGLLTALHFARSGDTVVATMRDTAKAGELERPRDQEGLPLDVASLDVTDDASVAAAVGRVLDEHGRVDVLVNNAGVGIDGAVEDVTDAEVKAVFETNVFGVLRVLRAVLPAMRAQGGGAVVNVSSLAGRVSPPFGGIYSASKFALEAISESLHYELGPFGIRVAIVEPGGFPTAFDANRHVAGRIDGSPYAEVRARWETAYARLPGRDGPPADPQDVAVAIRKAAYGEGPALRRLVGDDAVLIGGMRNELDDAEFERTIRTALDFWEGARR
jgi:NAD(P)-dependent dehydrogenase (short-subunit alcohol dehydrogenase family)